MTRFTVRVELHNADRDDYDTLHEQMLARGFVNEITWGDISYKLPPAEYNYSGDKTRKGVLELAKAAASSVVKSYAVLVTESAGRVQYGLAEA